MKILLSNEISSLCARFSRQQFKCQFQNIANFLPVLKYGSDFFLLFSTYSDVLSNLSKIRVFQKLLFAKKLLAVLLKPKMVFPISGFS